MVHLLLLYSLGSGLLDPLFNDTTHRGLPGTDFFVIYKAGRNLYRGESPYRIDPQEPPRSWGDYRYLPLSALTLSASVAWLPAESARRLWILVNECLLAASVFASFRLAKRPGSGLVAAALWLAFTPYYVELFIGQFDFLVAAGILGAAAAMLGRSSLIGEGGWFAATSAKWSGIAIAPLMLRRGRWRPLVIWSGAAASTAILYFMARPADFAIFWSTILRGGFATPHAGNYGLQALLSATMPLFVPDLFQDLARWTQHGALVMAYANLERVVLAAALTLALAATFFGKVRLTVGEGVALWTSLWAVGYNEFWEHQYVLLLPGLVLLYLEGRRALALSVWWPLAMPTLFFLVDRPHSEVVAAAPPGYDNPDLFLLLSLPQNLLLHLCKALPALLLFGSVVLSAWRAPSSDLVEPLGNVDV